MVIKKQLLCILVTSSITGCANNKQKPLLVDISIPKSGVISTAGLGETILRNESGYHTESITITPATSFTTSIDAGTYFRIYDNVYESKDNLTSVGYKDGFGNIIRWDNKITYTKNDNEVCPSDPFTHCYNQDDIDIVFKNNDFFHAKKTIKKTIEYNGYKDKKYHFTYREFKNNDENSIYHDSFSISLKERTTFKYRNSEIEIIKKENNKIIYKIIKQLK